MLLHSSRPLHCLALNVLGLLSAGFLICILLCLSFASAGVVVHASVETSGWSAKFERAAAAAGSLAGSALDACCPTVGCLSVVDCSAAILSFALRAAFLADPLVTAISTVQDAHKKHQLRLCNIPWLGWLSSLCKARWVVRVRAHPTRRVRSPTCMQVCKGSCLHVSRASSMQRHTRRFACSESTACKGPEA